MVKKCETCESELFQDDTNEWFCPKCEAEDFLVSFEQDDDSWMKTKFKVIKPKTKAITIRLNICDIEKAKNIAKLKNLPYQTLIKNIVHQNLM